MDLWLLENKYINNKQNSMRLILDEGIPKEPFKRFKFNSILENAKSEEHVGVRIADVLVAVAGNYISKLASDTKYDFNNLTKPKRVSIEFFNLDKSKFNLLKQMGKFFFKKDRTYGFDVDTYFDEGLLFESFLRYINEYESFNLYNKINSEHHKEIHLFFMLKIKEMI